MASELLLGQNEFSQQKFKVCAEEINLDTITRAVQLLTTASSGKISRVLKEEKSEMYAIISDMKKYPGRYEDIAVRLAREKVEGISNTAVDAYSIRYELQGEARTITLAVGDKFTALWYHKGDSLQEQVVQEGREIRYTSSSRVV